MTKHLVILGTRGIPAAYGGFETFAEKLALYMQARGWRVTVYCQNNTSIKNSVDSWNHIQRIHLTPSLFGRLYTGALGSVIFDLFAIFHCIRFDRKTVHLTLGYNTALFNIVLWILRRKQIFNMDGVEWKRSKWLSWVKRFLFLNYHIAGSIGNMLIADHPEIYKLLKKSFPKQKIATIGYGGSSVTNADHEVLERYGLIPSQYVLVIARPEPENSILEIVQAFSCEKMNFTLVVLGDYTHQRPYQNSVLSAACGNVVFPGPVYHPVSVNALRFFAKAYIHGHTVGGTNPSLVEALGAGCAVIAHDNEFNRGVADNAAVYFKDQTSLKALFDTLDTIDLGQLKINARLHHENHYTWPHILKQYEVILDSV